MPRFSTEKILGKVIQYGDDLVGHSARKYKNMAQTLYSARKVGPHGVPASTIDAAENMASDAAKRSLNTRVTTGVGVVGVGAGGFLGMHKYHQHKDNKILARIDKMYKKG